MNSHYREYPFSRTVWDFTTLWQGEDRGCRRDGICPALKSQHQTGGLDHGPDSPKVTVKAEAGNLLNLVLHTERNWPPALSQAKGNYTQSPISPQEGWFPPSWHTHACPDCLPISGWLGVWWYPKVFLPQKKRNRSQGKPHLQTVFPQK